ncbi:MAG: hypothetical protein ACI30A_06780 [Paludibacteraceae bacterium]
MLPNIYIKGTNAAKESVILDVWTMDEIARITPETSSLMETIDYIVQKNFELHPDMKIVARTRK